MDIIFIKNLRFAGRHGVLEREKEITQNFQIDIRLHVVAPYASRSDIISDAVDYRPVRDAVRSIIEEHSYNLIETIVENIARRILEDARIHTATVTLKKLDIWGNGTPGISITRTNE